MKKAKILIISLLLTNSYLWAIDAQSFKEEVLGLLDKSKDIADKVSETALDTGDNSEPLREAIGEKSAEFWDDSEPLQENSEEKTKDSWKTAKEWSSKNMTNSESLRKIQKTRVLGGIFLIQKRKVRMIQQSEIL